MPVDLRKVAKDLVCEDQDIRILALTTVVQLSPGSIGDPEELVLLRAGLEEATKLGDQDTIFLARKGLNHLAQLDAPAKRGEPVASAASPQDSPAPAAPTPPPPDPVAARAVLAEPSSDAVALASALATLTREGAEAGDVDRAAPLLEHEDARVRANAVELVEAVADTSRIVPLLSPLLEDEHHRVRANANKALGQVGHPKVVETLKAMAGSGNLAAREASVYAMSFLKSPEIVDLLVHCLRDPYEGVRLRAVKALGRHKDPRSLPALREALNDMDIDVCEEAARVVRYISMESPQPLRDGYTEPEGAAVAGDAAEEDLTPEERARRTQRELVLFQFGQRVFGAMREGQFQGEGLRKPFYDVLRAQEFLAKQRERQAGGQLTEAEAQAARERVEAGIRAALVELARLTLASGAAGAPGVAEVRGALAELGDGAGGG